MFVAVAPKGTKTKLLKTHKQIKIAQHTLQVHEWNLLAYPHLYTAVTVKLVIIHD